VGFADVTLWRAGAVDEALLVAEMSLARCVSVGSIDFAELLAHSFEHGGEELMITLTAGFAHLGVEVEVDDILQHVADRDSRAVDQTTADAIAAVQLAAEADASECFAERATHPSQYWHRLRLVELIASVRAAGATTPAVCGLLKTAQRDGVLKLAQLMPLLADHFGGADHVPLSLNHAATSATMATLLLDCETKRGMAGSRDEKVLGQVYWGHKFKHLLEAVRRRTSEVGKFPSTETMLALEDADARMELSVGSDLPRIVPLLMADLGR
jgi:hypothetical protein